MLKVELYTSISLKHEEYMNFTENSSHKTQRKLAGEQS